MKEYNLTPDLIRSGQPFILSEAQLNEMFIGKTISSIDVNDYKVMRFNFTDGTCAIITVGIWTTP